MILQILPGLLLLLGLVAGSCSPLRLLGPRQQLLAQIRLEGVKQADAERIQALYQQKPNSRFPLPKLAIYQLGYTFYKPEELQERLIKTQADYDRRIRAAGTDSVKVGKLLAKREKRTSRLQLTLDKGNAVMRLGEAPVIYDSALTRKTAEQIAIFLRSQGFFRSSVTALDTLPYEKTLVGRADQVGNEVDKFIPRFSKRDSIKVVEGRQQVLVIYRVRENQPFKYSQLEYDIADTAIARVVLASQSASLLRPGDRYNEEAIGQERARLESLLKNAGYYDFRQLYITLEADTSYAPYTVRLRTRIANPSPGETHHVFTIRRVNFLTDAGTVRFGAKRDTILYNSVRYLAFKQKFKPRALDRKLTVRPGQRFSMVNTLTTQRQLSDLDMFRFNTVAYSRVRTDTTRYQLDATVNASPTKKLQEFTELGGTVVAGLPGPFGNVRLKIRNLLGGAEILEIGLRAGFEGQLSRVGGDTRKSVLTRQLGANMNLVLPRFLVPWSSSSFLARYNPRTRFNANYTFVFRPEYTRTNLEGTFDYIWQRSTFHQYVLTPVDISLINTPKDKIDADFQANLDALALKGSPLYRSFVQLYVPSMNATSLYNSNDFNQTRDARYLRLFAEIGGITRPLYQNAIQPLQVYDFARLSADFRRYHKLAPNQFLVYRLNAGVAHALTKTSVQVTDPVTGVTRKEDQYIIPYDKYFFAGGSSSVRAWKPRRLGTGSYTATRDENGQPVRDYNIEQPGEVLLEGSVEYRFPVWSFVHGALFTDFGNVWTLEDKSRPEAQFRTDRFLRQIGVGSGIGVRFDFTFLIVRLDVAGKVYDPSAIGEKFVLPNFSFQSQFNKVAYNVGIGYPF